MKIAAVVVVYNSVDKIFDTELLTKGNTFNDILFEHDGEVKSCCDCKAMITSPEERRCRLQYSCVCGIAITFKVLMNDEKVARFITEMCVDPQKRGD